MKCEKFLNNKAKITQIKSGLKSTEKLKGNLIGLGLRGIGSCVELKITPQIAGMIKKANHLLKIELI